MRTREGVISMKKGDMIRDTWRGIGGGELASSLCEQIQEGLYTRINGWVYGSKDTESLSSAHILRAWDQEGSLPHPTPG